MCRLYIRLQTDNIAPVDPPGRASERPRNRHYPADMSDIIQTRHGSLAYRRM